MKHSLNKLYDSKQFILTIKKLFCENTKKLNINSKQEGVSSSNKENKNSFKMSLNKKEDLIEKHMYEPAPKNTPSAKERTKQNDDLSKLNPDMYEKEGKNVTNSESFKGDLETYNNELDEILEDKSDSKK